MHNLFVEGLSGGRSRSDGFAAVISMRRLPKPSFLVQPFNESRPLRHLFRERALRAIGIVLHAKILVDLEQPLLVCDGFQKLLPARIVSEKACRSCFEPRS